MASVLGPLTTTFTPPPSCLSMFNTYYFDTGPYQVGPTAIAQSDCFPSGYADSRDRYYSPGLACPVGYTGSETQVIANTETEVICCPTSYYPNLLTQTENWAATLGCVQAVEVSRTLSPIIFRGVITTTVVAIPSATIYAFSIRLRWQSSDIRAPGATLTASTTVAPVTSTPSTISSAGSSTPSTTSAAGSSTPPSDSRLSTGAAIGIGVGIAVVVVLLVSGALWFAFRMRKRKRMQSATETSRPPMTFQSPRPEPLHQYSAGVFYGTPLMGSETSQGISPGPPAEIATPEPRPGPFELGDFSPTKKPPATKRTRH